MVYRPSAMVNPPTEQIEFYAHLAETRLLKSDWAVDLGGSGWVDF